MREWDTLTSCYFNLLGKFGVTWPGCLCMITPTPNLPISLKKIAIPVILVPTASVLFTESFSMDKSSQCPSKLLRV